MKYDNYTEKERALQPFGVTTVKTMYGTAPSVPHELSAGSDRQSTRSPTARAVGRRLFGR